MAVNVMFLPRNLPRRVLLFAYVTELTRTASVEIAPTRRIEGTGNYPAEADAFLLCGRVGYRHSREQSLCIRMIRW